MPKDRYEIEGRSWLSIARAAKLLGTNAQGVRKLMAEGALDWCQSRANSMRFLVDEQAVNQLAASPSVRKKRKLARSPDPLKFPPRPEPQCRQRGDLWQGHHLRLTLPHEDDKEEQELDSKR